MKSRFVQIGLALCALIVSIPLFAAQRTFVSTGGINNPACSLTAPCRDFAAAITATSAGGEVIVLDSGGFGPVTITQSVSIIAPSGIYAGVSVFTGDGVTIAAGATDKVVLRGLTINGQGGDTGLVLSSAAEVHIEHCTVTNMQTGIFAADVAKIFILGTTVRSNGSAGGVGLISGVVGTPEVHVTDSQFSRNSWGIRISAGIFVATRIVVESSVYNGISVAGDKSINVTIVESVLSGNGGIGAYAGSYPGKSVQVAFVRSTSTRNAYGGLEMVGAGGPALLIATDSSVVDNNVGIIGDGANAMVIVTDSTIAGSVGADLVQMNSAIMLTSGNNTLSGRGAADISGTLTPNPLK
jgi:hypothetical protein